MAVRPAQLSFLSRAAFEEFANKNPEVYRSLLTLTAARLRETDGTVAAGSFLPLRGRVACTLLELAQGFGQDVGAGRIVIRQKIGQADLAAMAGIARENVSRILNDWKRQADHSAVRVLLHRGQGATATRSRGLMVHLHSESIVYNRGQLRLQSGHLFY